MGKEHQPEQVPHEQAGPAADFGQDASDPVEATTSAAAILVNEHERWNISDDWPLVVIESESAKRKHFVSKLETGCFLEYESEPAETLESIESYFTEQ